MEVSESRRTILTQCLAMFAVGLYVALWRSFSLLDPVFLITFLCCAGVLAGPIVVAGYPQYSDRLALVRHAVIRAFAMTLLALVVALAWLNYRWHGDLLLPDGPIFASALLLGISVTTLAAVLVLLLRDRLNARRTTWAYRATALAVLLIYRFFPQSSSNRITEFFTEHGPAQVVLGLAVVVTAMDAAFLLNTSQKWPDEL
ncbi:MAG TPA: hypothetical protein VEX68_03395 [Bryobacteraceae bacterium]|nr:hypothetical protein [Bryobacteraceae bacterium]